MSTLHSAARRLEWIVAALALLVIPALVIESRAERPDVRLIGTTINWIVWLAFCVEFAVRWAADRTWAYLRRAWFDLLLIIVTPPFGVPDAIQSVRSIRVLRLLRLVRALAVGAIGFRLAREHFGKRNFHYIVSLACATVFLGAVSVYTVEAGQNTAIRSFGDALWWAVVTATTVGYGDVSPVTTEGRVIAVLLMLVGIGVIGVFTATVASLFFEQEAGSELASVEARLNAIEQKLDDLLSRTPPSTV